MNFNSRGFLEHPEQHKLLCQHKLLLTIIKRYIKTMRKIFNISRISKINIHKFVLELL